MAKVPAIIEATKKHTATVIFFHGLGDTGHGWRDTFAQYVAPYLPHVRFIFPHA